MTSNVFQNLDVDDTEYDINKKERKAKKMLRSIEKLKAKDTLTDEERIKLESEDEWRKVLNPFYVNPSNVYKETEKKQEKKKLTKKRKELEKKKEREQREQERREQERRGQERREQERRGQERREQERRGQERRGQERRGQEKMKKQEKTIKFSQNEIKIHIEYKKLIALGNNKQKAKQKLQFIYHPDKNPNTIKLSTELSQIINNI